jgi:hypothetical protein
MVHPLGLEPRLGSGLERTAYKAAVLRYTTGALLLCDDEVLNGHRLM